MNIHAHARPHLEVHSRSKGHSAVAGAAYRLGLRLYDNRQKCWHDFQKRALGEEIVRALTVSPKGSPSWCTDPQELWNRVERAERRSDSQVARDYRIPVPLGLSDQDAGDLAEEMARFICEELHVPVSLGLHRDADRDALGTLKPIERQGFHAHLYFPTRPLAELEEGKEGEGTGFGPKLHEFSKMHLGSAFIELLNCKWSELANDYAWKSGSDSKYQYKSYKRLGVNLTPQPTLGQSATAMERRGITSNRGDSLREALVMAEVYQKAHAGTLVAQHAQALQDVKRKHGTKPQGQGGVLSTSTRLRFHSSKRLAANPLIAPRGSLAYRLRTSAPAPTTKEEVEELERSLVLIEALDKAFAVYHQLQNELDELLRVIEARRAASLDAQFQVDQSRQRRTVAQVRLRRWEDENRWRIKFLASVGGMPMATHEKLRKNVQLHDGHVQALKATMVTHAIDVTEMEQQVEGLKVKQSEALSTIRNKACALDDAKSELIPELLKALPPTDRSILQEQLPTLFSDVKEGVDNDCKSRNATAAVMGGQAKAWLKKESTSAELHEVLEGPARGHSKPSF